MYIIQLNCDYTKDKYYYKGFKVIEDGCPYSLTFDKEKAIRYETEDEAKKAIDNDLFLFGESFETIIVKE